MVKALTFYQCDQIIKKAKDWDSLNDLVTEQSLSLDQDRIFERFTQLYLQTKSAYATKFMNLWLYEEVSKEIRDFENTILSWARVLAN